MKRSVVFFLAAALVMSGAPVGTAQQKANSTADFSFTMQNASGTMSLACEHGCAWKTLRWSGGSGADVLINDRGIIGGDNKEENSTFLVGIHAAATAKVELSCKRGCTWTALSYASLPARARIDENGVLAVSLRGAAMTRALSIWGEVRGGYLWIVSLLVFGIFLATFEIVARKREKRERDVVLSAQAATSGPKVIPVWAVKQNKFGP